ncbi:MAG: methyltransferase domain-containing protein [Myxococcota bacterium]
MPTLSVIIPFDQQTRGAAADLAQKLHGKAEVILVGEGELDLPHTNGTRVLQGVLGKGRALKAAIPLVTGEVTVLQDPDAAYSPQVYPQLLQPIEANAADVVFAVRAGRTLSDRALSRFTHWVTEASLSDPLSGQRAFRTEALRNLKLASTHDEVDAEIVVKLAAQLYRFAEVPVEAVPQRPLRSRLSNLRTLLRYASVQNDADNQHEGYNTLSRMESGAPNYNAYLGQRLRAHCGQRVLEVGAGIGTITAQLEEGRELVVALEVESFYVERLKNRFRDRPHVRPYLSDVALADWEALQKERFDTIVLSNVLEHIPDDAASVRRFADILAPQGKLLVLVPALPALYGSMDEAVGHHRRYTHDSLRTVLEENGFTVDHLEWLNIAGIPGWFFNGRVLRRRAVPALQLRVYDQLAPLFARVESNFRLPIGMSLFAVGVKRL